MLTLHRRHPHRAQPLGPPGLGAPIRIASRLTHLAMAVQRLGVVLLVGVLALHAGRPADSASATARRGKNGAALGKMGQPACLCVRFTVRVCVRVRSDVCIVT